MDRGRRGSIFTPETANEMKETIRKNSVINQYEGISDEAVLNKLVSSMGMFVSSIESVLVVFIWYATNMYYRIQYYY